MRFGSTWSHFKYIQASIPFQSVILTLIQYA